MKAFIIFLLLWISFSCTGYFLGRFLFNPDWPEHMTKSGQGVYGHVIAKEPENHQTVRYAYEVGETEYKGSGSGGDGNPDFEDLSIGDQIVIYYDPVSPYRSTMSNPWNELGRSYSAIWFLTITLPIFPMVFALAIYFGVRTRGLGSDLQYCNIA
jgi:hypothetical protein